MMSVRRERGFTLMEILVAIFVMGVGLGGIMALFPTGIKFGTESMKDTYSGILAQSVTDALTVAMRENRFSNPKIRGPYLVFDHDGILDDPSGLRIGNPDFSKDYIILLPWYIDPKKTKTFVYPETSNVPNGNGNVSEAEDDGERRVEDRNGNKVIAITKTYGVGQFLKKRMEDPNVTDYERREILAKDPYMQYSFAVVIRRARTDTDRNGVVDKRDDYSNFLYEVEVNIYRNFKADPRSKSNQPIHKMATRLEL